MLYCTIALYYYYYVRLTVFGTTEWERGYYAHALTLPAGHVQDSGVHKGGFSKRGCSNLCVIIISSLLNPPSLNPPL